MGCKSLVIILIIVSLFGLHQCYKDYDPDHPKGIERCYLTQLGNPFKLDYWCCIEEPSHCVIGIEPQQCVKECPPLRKGAAPSPSPAGYNPKGTERCFHKQLGWPKKLDFLCCIEKPSHCFPKNEPELCGVQCPPLRKGAAPSPSPGVTPAPLENAR